MRIIALIVTVQSLLSMNTHADTVHVLGQWANGPQVVYMLIVEDAITPKYANLKAAIDPATQRFEFNVDVARPTLLQFQNRYIIVLPGDSVIINITGNESNLQLEFEGTHRMEHNFLIRLSEAMGLFPAAQFKLNEGSIEHYKKAATHHYDSSLLFLVNDIKKYNGRKAFEKIAQGYLTTRYYANLLYPVSARLLEKEKLPEYYFELVDFSFFKKTDLLGFRDFIEVASDYNDHYYATLQNGSGSYDSASVAARIKSANYNFFGEVKDNLLLLIYASLTQHGSEINSAQIQTLYEYLSGVFNEEPKRIEHLRELKHEFDILDAPFPLKTLAQELTTPKGKLTTLAEILATTEVIYIVLWASWCEICVGEMPAQKQLMMESEGKQVKFVFISFDKDEKAWQKALTKLKVKGDHYMISDGYTSILARYVSINQIPRYLILDKRGRLVDHEAPNPSGILQDKSILLSLVE